MSDDKRPSVQVKITTRVVRESGAELDARTHECISCTARLPTCTHRWVPIAFAHSYQWCSKCGAMHDMRKSQESPPLLPVAYVACQRCARIGEP